VVNEVVKEWSVFNPRIATSPKRLRLRLAAMLLAIVAMALIFVFASEQSWELLHRLWRVLAERASAIATESGLPVF
jgi:hypothetical protein